jgi:hypothetical protein
MKKNPIKIKSAAVAFMSMILTSNSNAQVKMSPGNYSQDFNTRPTADSSWTGNSTLLGWITSVGTNTLAFSPAPFQLDYQPKP